MRSIVDYSVVARRRRRRRRRNPSLASKRDGSWMVVGLSTGEKVGAKLLQP
jgi:hypothetical protein